jgi:hypothetical protein
MSTIMISYRQPARHGYTCTVLSFSLSFISLNIYGSRPRLDVIPKKRTLKLMGKLHRGAFRSWLPFYMFPDFSVYPTSSIAAADAEYFQAIAVTENQPLVNPTFIKRSLVELEEVSVFTIVRRLVC